jgi:hypothetical protein
MAPDINPIIMCWYDGSSARSGWYRCANFLISWYAVKFAPNIGSVTALIDLAKHNDDYRTLRMNSHPG